LNTLPWRCSLTARCAWFTAEVLRKCVTAIPQRSVGQPAGMRRNAAGRQGRQAGYPSRSSACCPRPRSRGGCAAGEGQGLATVSPAKAFEDRGAPTLVPARWSEWESRCRSTS
jgi:hypothetical protein